MGAAAARAAGPQDVLREGTPILASLAPLPTPGGPVEEVAINHPDFQRAWRLTSRTQGLPQRWSVAVRWLSRLKVKTGDVLLVVFSMRCVNTSAADCKATATVAFGTAAAPFQNALVVRARADQEWKKFQFPLIAPRDLGAGEAKLSIGAGTELQTFEIGGAEVYNFGSTKKVSDFQNSNVYQGIEANAPWRRECLARIERIRKSTLEVVVTDAGGRPLADADVRVVMKRHAFGFGCTFNPVVFDLAGRYPREMATYQQRFVEYFNIATPKAVMNWKSWETRGTRERLAQTLSWLDAHHIPVIAHPLVWQAPKTLLPRALELLKHKDYAGYLHAWNEHLADKVTCVRGRVCEYLVINEFVDTNFLPEPLTDDALVAWYQLVKRLDPGARLGILDHKMIGYGAVEAETNVPWYERKIEMLLRRKVPLEIVAVQGHFGDVLTDPHRMLHYLDRLAKFGLELQITEFDVEMDNEKLQAQYLRDFFIAAFSHPSVQVVQQWGFYEPLHWRPRAALFRKDWSAKPNGQAFLDLVFRQWWTDTRGTTDGRGHYATRAFHGDYEVTVSRGDRQQTVTTQLGKSGRRLTVRL